MHTLATPFGKIDVIFFGDLYQAAHVHDSWIFEHPSFKATSTSYNFWRDNVIDFELKQVMRHENKELSLS